MEDKAAAAMACLGLIPDGSDRGTGYGDIITGIDVWPAGFWFSGGRRGSDISPVSTSTSSPLLSPPPSLSVNAMAHMGLTSDGSDGGIGGGDRRTCTGIGPAGVWFSGGRKGLFFP